MLTKAYRSFKTDQPDVLYTAAGDHRKNDLELKADDHRRRAGFPCFRTDFQLNW